MKKLVYIIFLVMVVIICIPLLVLQRVGGVIKDDKSSDKTGPTIDGRVSELIFDDQNGGGPKIKVYIVENKELKEMYLEEYIRGVVAGEMPAEFDIEALKAQAVAARTYAVTKMKSLGGKGCSNHAEADICTDSTHCQEWISKEERFKAWGEINAPKYWEKITTAVNDTKGMILTYNAAPVMYPLYFSTSGGKTENSEDVFMNSYPYLRSVVSIYEEEAPKFLTKIAFTKDEFIKKFGESEYKIKLDKSKLASQVTIMDRTEGGAVNNIKIGTKTLKGTKVREILGLSSANFNIEIGDNEVKLTVMGNGHGVGMSQWGANGLGKHGQKFDEILKHYYQGTEISKVTGTFF